MAKHRNAGGRFTSAANEHSQGARGAPGGPAAAGALVAGPSGAVEATLVSAGTALADGM